MPILWILAIVLTVCVIGVAGTWFIRRTLANTVAATLTRTPHALPVIQVQPRPVARVCQRCKHFDLAEGQAAMKTNPYFVQAQSHVSPAEMGRHVVGTKQVPCKTCGASGLDAGKVYLQHGVLVPKPCPEDGCINGYYTQDVMSEPGAPYKAAWSEFGACMNPDPAVANVVIWSQDTCEHWEQA